MSVFVTFFLQNIPTGARIGGIYINIRSEDTFSQWKINTEALASQQGNKRFLIGQMSVSSEEELYTMWGSVEAETDQVKQKQEKIKYLKQMG